MTPVLVNGIERPDLASALLRRGLEPVATGAAAAALLACAMTAEPQRTVLQCPDAASGSAALDRGVADVVLASDPDELVASRLAALVRRTMGATIRIGALVIDPLERRARLDAVLLDLLPREFALLLHLARRHGHAASTAELRLAVLGRSFDTGTNAIAVHVSRVRTKLGARGVAIVTRKGEGYRLIEQGQSA